MDLKLLAKIVAHRAQLFEESIQDALEKSLKNKNVDVFITFDTEFEREIARRSFIARIPKRYVKHHQNNTFLLTNNSSLKLKE